ncbi:hypothetical protein [Herbiconiux flava]|uniref:Uncharacterized protein n=1 Tax=Herbiconiux flava TaxID=881268 RepID=A0A852STU9_9MICO|nr:hypothetical protein [Herbiconiux flava]NYD72287.1 hypothetical protein [Herbiconiux flava]GLK17750.1 hypothetical protein GCM10017602_22320 [Herbiconiux flava]
MTPFELIGYPIAAVITFVVLYYVVRGAILSALREHTRTSTTAVSLVTSKFHKADSDA